MPFLGMAQSTTFSKNLSTSSIRTRVLKNNANLWSFRYLDASNSLTIVTTTGEFSIPTDSTVVTESKTLSLNLGTGLALTSGTATQNLVSNPSWTIGLNASSSPTFTGITLSGASASTIASFDGSKNIVALSTSTYPSLTELSYVKGATSNIQTQFANIATTYMPKSGGVFTGNVDLDYEGARIRLKDSEFNRSINFEPESGILFGAYNYSSTGVLSEGKVRGSVLKLYGDSNSGIDVSSTGNAGFGNTSPTEKVDVTGNIKASGNLIGILKTTTGAGVGNMLTSDASGVGSWATASTVRTNLGLTALATTTPASGIATFLGTPSSSNFFAALTTKTGTGNAVFSADATLTGTTTTSIISNISGANLAISSGNVGIGTAFPTQKLDVSGIIRATLGYLLDGTSNKVLSIQTALNNRAFFGGWQDGAYITSNRNPADGVFADIAKAAALIGVTGTTNDSNIEFRTTTTNNTLPSVRMFINGSGNVGIGNTSTPSLFSVGSSSQFQVSSTGVTTAAQYRVSALNTAPTSATDTGTLGEVRITSTYIYVCTATNTWVRSALTTW